MASTGKESVDTGLNNRLKEYGDKLEEAIAHGCHHPDLEPSHALLQHYVLDVDTLSRQVDELEKHRPFEPDWIYVSTGELPPLEDGAWGPNGKFMSYDVLLTIQTPENSWVVNGRRHLGYPSGWDCYTAAIYPDVRKIVAWAYPDRRRVPEIKPASRIELPAPATDEAT